MNPISIILIIAIIAVMIFFEYMLIVKKVYPWNINFLSMWDSGMKLIIQDTLPSDDKMCSVANLGTGTIQDYMGNVYSSSDLVQCNECIKYLSTTSSGCSQLQYDGDDTCELYGDNITCPTPVLASYDKTIKI